MSAVWSRTWRIIETGLQVPSSICAKSSRAALQHGPFSRSLWIQSEACLKVPSGLISAPNYSSRSRYALRRSPSLTLPQAWKAAFSDRTEASNVSAPALPKLSAVDIRTIFGGSLDQRGGNKLLQVLQDQRISGTLDQEISASPKDISKGLSWLRNAHPVDEDGAIIARLIREEEGAGSSDVYGGSVLDEWREHNRQKAAQKEAESATDSSAEIDTMEDSRPRAVVTRKTEPPEWVKRYMEDATGNDEKPPEMTKFQRLWPSTAVVFAVVGLSILFAQNYTPPPRKARLWPDIPPAAATIVALIGINVIVFAAWRLVPPAWKILNTHFVVVAGLPRSTGLIGSIFSHQKLSHLVSNMVVMWFVGTRLHDDVGRGSFLAILISTGVISSYVSMARFVFQNVFHAFQLGASGSICGLIASWSWIHAWDKIAIPFVPSEWTQNIPCVAFLVLFICIDVLGLFRRQGMYQTDRVAHLAGFAAGIGAGQTLKYRSRLRRQGAMDRKRIWPW